MKHEYIECACYALEHTLRFNLDPKDEDPRYMIVDIHLNAAHRCSFWQRLKYAFVYILFGREYRLGHFEEALLDESKVLELKNLCDKFLEKE